MDITSMLLACIFVLAGLIIGWTYFQLMRHAVIRYCRHDRDTKKFVGWTVLRLFLFISGVALAFLAGTWSILGFLLGFLIIRTVVIRCARNSLAQMAAPATRGGRSG